MPKVELPDLKPFEDALRLGIAKTFRKAVKDHAGYQTLRAAQGLLSRAWEQYMDGPAKLYDWDDARYWKLATRFKEAVFKAMLNAMCAAKRDGVFGTVAERRHRFIIFDITDSQRAEDHRVAWSRKLNVASVAEAYQRNEIPHFGSRPK